MNIQILINHYNESLNIIRRLLSSLSSQRGVQFEVIMCGDGGSKISYDDLKGYPFNIVYSYVSHSGVCRIRNLLLDKSNADYIMFCDADDVFYKTDGLKSLLDAIESSNSDVVASPFYAENNSSDGFPTYDELKYDNLHVHGKLFRREYIIKNHIRFPDEMETGGDMMFLWLAFCLTNKVTWLENNFYIWKYNKCSVTRKSKYHRIENYDKTLKCYSILINDLKQRERIDLLYKLLSTLFPMMYIDATRPMLEKVPYRIKHKAKRIILEFVKDHFNLYKEIGVEDRKFGFDTMVNFTNAIDLIESFSDLIPFFENVIKRSQMSYETSNINSALPRNSQGNLSTSGQHCNSAERSV